MTLQGEGRNCWGGDRACGHARGRLCAWREDKLAADAGRACKRNSQPGLCIGLALGCQWPDVACHWARKKVNIGPQIGPKKTWASGQKSNNLKKENKAQHITRKNK